MIDRSEGKPSRMFAERYVWWTNKAREVLGILPERSRLLLGRVHMLASAPEVPRAALIGLVASRYGYGESPDEIAEDLSRSFFLHSDVTEKAVLRDLVLPVCEKYRICQLPFEAFWDPHRIYYELLNFYVGCRLSEDDQLDNLRSELSSHWLLEREETKDGVIQSARLGWVQPDLTLMEDPPGGPVGAVMRAAQSDPKFERTMEDYLSSLSPRILDRPYLVRLLRFIVLASFVSKQGVPAEVEQAVVEAAEKVGTVEENLSPSEQDLFVRQVSDESYLRRMIPSKSIIRIDEMGPNALPDRVGGAVQFPEWVRDYIFSDGGRLRHGVAGPIPHFLLAIERWTGPTPTAVGFGEIRLVYSELTVPLVVVDGTNDPPIAEFRYNLDAAHDLLDLLWLAVVGRARVDLIEIQSAGSLNLLVSVFGSVHETILEQLRTVLIPALRSRYGEDNERLYADVVSGLTNAPDYMPFLMDENAKSEQLYTDFSEALLGVPGGKQDGRLGRYRCVKSELLQARAEYASLRQARLILDLTTIAARVESLEDELSRLRETLPSAGLAFGSRRTDPEDTLKSYAQTLGSDARCFLHLGFHDGYLVGSWVHPNGSGMASGWIEFPELDLYHLGELAERWLNEPNTSARRALLAEVLDALGAQLGATIAEALVPEGVTDLILSPCGFTELLPLHCAPVSLCGQTLPLCDVFHHISYAPSLRILEGLKGLGPASGRSCLALSYAGTSHELQNTEYELALLRQLFSEVTTLDGKDATPEAFFRESPSRSVIHTACHGQYVFDDFYCSGLQLFGDPSYEGWLSAASILARGEFRTAGLVTLAACETGRSLSQLHTIQNYSGLDGVFLARGAHSVVSAMWEVHDLASFLFSAAFYCGVAGGATIDDAFSRAVRFVRDPSLGEEKVDLLITETLKVIRPDWREESIGCGHDFSHPYYWGSFKCSGLAWCTCS